MIAAEAEGIGPALFVVESGAKGLSVEAEPAMGLRPAATGRLLIENVQLPASALLGEGDAKAKDYVDCVNRSRIAWCGLATGAAQAVLDYVIPYVNDRQAFGEPISNRQGVAFAVSDIGIESEGMRLATYRAASRADRGEKLRPRGGDRPPALRRQGDADRLRRRAAARRPRLRQGAPGRALVPRPASSGRDGGRPARLGDRRIEAKGRRS